MKAMIPQRLYDDNYLESNFREVIVLSSAISMIQLFMSTVKKYISNYGGCAFDETRISIIIESIKSYEYDNGACVYSIEDSEDDYVLVSIQAPKSLHKYGLYSVDLFICKDDNSDNIIIHSIDLKWFYKNEHKLETGMTPQELCELYESVVKQNVQDFTDLTR